MPQSGKTDRFGQSDTRNRNAGQSGRTSRPGKIPPAGSITYEIVLLEGNNQVPVAKDLTTNTYTIENAYDAEGEQVFKQWGVFPVNETGHGAGMATNGLILGADYTVPFVESFADKSQSHLRLVEAEQNV